MIKKIRIKEKARVQDALSFNRPPLASRRCPSDVGLGDSAEYDLHQLFINIFEDSSYIAVMKVMLSHMLRKSDYCYFLN